GDGVACEGWFGVESVAASGGEGGDRDCNDFASWSEAQAFYDANGGNNFNGLDSDEDGIACEALAGAPAPEPTMAPQPSGSGSVDSGGATALCNDGTLSYAAHHQGACSHHGGVAVWYK